MGGTGLQGQSVFKTKLTFRPHSIDSVTHRKMTMSLADKCSKTNKVKVLPIPLAGHNPESNRQALLKKEEDKLKTTVRREAQQRRVKEKQASKGLTGGYLDDDDDDDENSVSISKLKNKYKADKQGKSGAQKAPIYSSDSDADSYGSDVEKKK